MIALTDEEKIKNAFVNICNNLIIRALKKFQYDIHYTARVLSVNSDGTCRLISSSNGKERDKVRVMPYLTLSEEDLVNVRETKNLPDSACVDEILKKSITIVE